MATVTVQVENGMQAQQLVVMAAWEALEDTTSYRGAWNALNTTMPAAVRMTYPHTTAANRALRAVWSALRDARDLTQARRNVAGLCQRARLAVELDD